MAIRYFGTARVVSADGSVVIERADGVGRVFVGASDAALAGEILVGDVLEFGIRPGGIAVDVLVDRRARHLAAAGSAK